MCQAETIRAGACLDAEQVKGGNRGQHAAGWAAAGKVHFAGELGWIKTIFFRGINQGQGKK
jgi:hypothetical protein